MTWWEYVQRIAGSATSSEISRRTGINQSSITRWQISSPRPESVAAFARAYGRPVLEAFIAAGFLTEEEAQVTQIEPLSTGANMTDDELINELRNRLRKSSANGQ